MEHEHNTVIHKFLTPEMATADKTVRWGQNNTANLILETICNQLGSTFSISATISLH
jgi:hypothetical protein